MSLGGIYVAPRGLIVFFGDLIWLTLSTAILVTAGCASRHVSVSPILILDWTAIIVIAYIAAFYVMDLYAAELLSPRPELLLNLAEAVGLICLGLGILTLVKTDVPFSPELVLTQASVTVLFVLGGRMLFDRIRPVGDRLSRIGLLADAATRNILQHESSHLRGLGLRIDWLGDQARQVENALERISHRGHPIKRLVVDSSLLDVAGALAIIRKARDQGIVLEELEDFTERTLGKVRLAPELSCDLVRASLVTMSAASLLFRRARDLVVACAALPLSVPLAVLVALAIKCDSPGPVLFVQERIGKYGRPFKMLKFRSMRHDAESSQALSWSTRAADPRVTRVGTIMRLVHLDELPQLINVICGQMSIVGPRPFNPGHYQRLESQSPYLGLRQLAMPGMTGWAQICCDYDASVNDFEEVISRDLYYIKHASFAFDLLIMLETLRVCLWRRGAR